MRPGSRNVNSEEVTDLEEVSDGGVIYRGQDWCQRARLKKQQYSSAWWQVQDSHGFAKQKLTRFEACTTCFRRCACQSLLIPQKLQPSCSADGMERINAENMSVWEGWDSSWDGWFYKPGFDQRVMHYSGHGHAFSPMAFFDLQYFNVSWLETNIRLASFVQCVVMADIDETEFWEAFVRRWGVHVLLYLPPVSLALWGLLALALPMALGSSAWSMLGGAPADAQLVQAIEARADALRRQIVQKQTHPSRKDVAMLYMNFVLFCADLVSDWVVLVEFALAGEVGLAGAQTAIIVGPLLLDCYRGKIQVGNENPPPLRETRSCISTSDKEGVKEYRPVCAVHCKTIRSLRSKMPLLRDQGIKDWSLSLPGRRGLVRLQQSSTQRLPRQRLHEGFVVGEVRGGATVHGPPMVWLPPGDGRQVPVEHAGIDGPKRLQHDQFLFPDV